MRHFCPCSNRIGLDFWELSSKWKERFASPQVCEIEITVVFVQSRRLYLRTVGLQFSHDIKTSSLFRYISAAATDQLFLLHSTRNLLKSKTWSSCTWQSIMQSFPKGSDIFVLLRVIVFCSSSDLRRLDIKRKEDLSKQLLRLLI